MSDKPSITPRKDLAEEARKHYERLANAAGEWNSVIPDAIDDWGKEPQLFQGLLDTVGVLVWKAGGTVVITEHDKRIMPPGVYVEVMENKIDGITTFRVVSIADTKQDGEK